MHFEDFDCKKATIFWKEKVVSCMMCLLYCFWNIGEHIEILVLTVLVDRLNLCFPAASYNISACKNNDRRTGTTIYLKVVCCMASLRGMVRGPTSFHFLYSFYHFGFFRGSKFNEWIWILFYRKLLNFRHRPLNFEVGPITNTPIASFILQKLVL